MESRWVKAGLPVLILIISILSFQVINKIAGKEVSTVPIDNRPLVETELARLESHQVIITEFGAVEPVEVTPVAAQVSGEVVSWNADFLEGGRVRRGELLFSIEKDAYESAVLQAEARLSQAQAALIEQEALAEVAVQEAQKNPGRKYSDLFLRKPQLISARANVKSATAALRIARRDLDNCDVHAPFDALVVSTDIGKGQFLGVGAPVATLYSIDTAKILLPVPGFDSVFLPGDLAGREVVIEEIVGSGSETRASRVNRIGRIRHDLGLVDEATRMSHLLIEIEDPYSIRTDAEPIKFGTYVQVSFVGKRVSNVFRLPQELVNNRTVWVVNDSSRLESRAVEILREDGDHLLIGSGLQVNDRIVTTLPEYPQQGMEVRTNNLPEENRASDEAGEASS